MRETNEDKLRWIRSQATDAEIREIFEQRNRLLEDKVELQQLLIEAIAELYRLRSEREQQTEQGASLPVWTDIPEAQRELDRGWARQELAFAPEGEPPDWTADIHPAPAPKPKDQKLNVLVVDDNYIVRFFWRKLLENSGHHVILGENGLDAVKMAQSQKPDIIFIDLNMPLLGGCDAARRLRLLPETKEIPIIAFSGDDRPETRAQAREAGCDDFVSKQIDANKLSAILIRFTGRH